MAIPIGVFNGMAQGMNYMTQLAYHQMQQHEQQKQQMAMIQYKNQLEGQRQQQMLEAQQAHTEAMFRLETATKNAQAMDMEAQRFEHEKTLRAMQDQDAMNREKYKVGHREPKESDIWKPEDDVSATRDYMKGQESVDQKYSNPNFIQSQKAAGLSDGQITQNKYKEQQAHADSMKPLFGKSPVLKDFVEKDLSNRIPGYGQKVLYGPARPTGVLTPK